MKVLVLIPARYASSRFPGKPLAKIGGVEMIVRVCSQVAKTGFDLAVATDDERIAQCVENAGYKAVMTSENHRSGTERICEAYDNLHSDADIVVNVQGDEPFIHPDQISQLVDIFHKDADTCLATLAREYPRTGSFEGIKDPNLVKLVKNDAGEALYFSRSVIPYQRGVEEKLWPSRQQYYTHVGIYAYRAKTLHTIVALPTGRLEQAESLEQLRWLENGYKIMVGITDKPTVGIDTPEDLSAAEKLLNQSS